MPRHGMWGLLVLGMGLMGCGQLLPEDLGRSSTEATLQGQVVTPILSAGVAVPQEARFVEGEALVRFKSGASSSSLRGLSARDLGSLELLRQPKPSHDAVQASSASGQDTLSWIEELRRRPDVEYAEPNYLRFASQSISAPNDPLYASHNRNAFDLLNLRAAWQMTTGSPSVVVAVLDDGILWRNNDPTATHPDFACGRVLPGYDFASLESNGDGDGRDNDPYQVGSDHGSHVAGTIGACSNNALGVSGVDWSARILPVRVLGTAGGTDADVIDGIRWASGADVVGLARNPHPAKVLNMSLSGPGLSRAFDEAINEATDRGVIVVVAADNHNQDALLYSPAGSERVITVGASDLSGRKASFSNFGPGVEVTAPGVSIYSTASGDTPGSFGYKAFQGTSMSSPHIAGIVALMAAVRPQLTWVEAFDYLTKSTKPLAECNNCGGLVDAADAVRRARRGDAVGGFVTPSLRWSFNLSPGQGQTLRLSLRNYGNLRSNLIAPAHPHLKLEPSNLTIAPGQSLEATLSLSGSPVSGSFYSTLLLQGSDRSTALMTQYQVGSGISNLGAIRLALCREVSNAASELVHSTTLQHTQGYYNFKVPIPNLSGSQYYLRAWVDQDGDRITEWVSYRRYVPLDGSSKQGINLTLTAEHFTLDASGCVAN